MTLKKNVTIVKRNQEKKTKPLNVRGEESISGSATAPHRDDNALEAAQETGLYPYADESKLTRVGVGRQINEAEKRRRTTRTTGRRKR